MKYVKYGIAAVAAQNINAKCCCKSEEDKTLDEFVKYFNVSKDNILCMYNLEGILTREDFKKVAQKTREAIQKFNELKKNKNKLKLYFLRKTYAKKQKVITIILATETFKVSDELKNITKNEAFNISSKQEDKILYSVGDENDIKTDTSTFYIKK